MSFGSDPGRDDGSLPPVNIVIPDDARELDRDVIAYRREMRATRRRKRFLRLLRPLRGHSAVLPLIATCVALSMLTGVMLSVVTVGPASAPTVPAAPPSSAAPATLMPALRPNAPGPMGTARLPRGTFSVNGTPEQVATLRTAALALVPPNCACDPGLRRLARAARTAHVGLYFVGEGRAIPRIRALTSRDGDGIAAAAADTAGVLGAAYHPSGLTILLVYSNGTVLPIRGPAASPVPVPVLRTLTRPGR